MSFKLFEVFHVLLKRCMFRAARIVSPGRGVFSGEVVSTSFANLSQTIFKKFLK